MYNYHRIRDLREDTDKSQEKIAKELNMHTTTYARYETGENRVPFDFAITLSNYYNVSLDYIAGRTNDKRGLNKSDLPKEELEMIKKFHALSEKQRGIIMGRIEAFTEENAEISEKEERLKGAV